MKKEILLVLACFFISASNVVGQSASGTNVVVQTAKSSLSTKSKAKDLYGQWSIELNAGSNKPLEPFATGYYASEPNRFSNIGVLNHFGVGVRYMMSNTFGFKTNVQYDKISNNSTSNSKKFEVSLFTYSLEGVLNLGRMARFETFTSRFSVLAHFGVQTTYKEVILRAGVTDALGVTTNISEQDGGIVLGLTPQYKLGKKVTIFADFSYYSNFRQHINWDGSSNADNNLNGTMYTSTIGISLNLFNKGKEHADWYFEPSISVEDNALKRLQEVEAMVTDTDRDGIPDYRDLQNNSPSGVTVDTKGRFIDLNKNGISDEVEKNSIPNIDSKAENIKIDVSNSNDSNSNDSNFDVNISDVVKELIRNGYFNIFFDIGKDYPNDGSTASVYQIINYLKLSPSAKVKLVGYTDKKGRPKSNMDLSKRRAESVLNLISGSGINANRVKIEGFGVDNNVPSDLQAGSNMARRVSVIIEK